MLQHRVLTAIPLAFAVIWLILFQPTDVFVYLLFLIAVIAGHEWSALCGFRNQMARIAYALLIVIVAMLFIYVGENYIQWVVLGSVLFWIMISLKIKFIKPELNSELSIQKIFIGLLLIPATALSMWAIHGSDNGAQWLMYGLALVWVADIGAYFAGKRFGKNKLAENISPGKTVEGLLGAVIATSIYSIFCGYYFELTFSQIIILLPVSLLLTLISIVGDLYESTLKRVAGLKDSGKILPGHGGILDRIDSLLAAMPVFSVATHFVFHPVFSG